MHVPTNRPQCRCSHVHTRRAPLRANHSFSISRRRSHCQTFLPRTITACAAASNTTSATTSSGAGPCSCITTAAAAASTAGAAELPNNHQRPPAHPERQLRTPLLDAVRDRGDAVHEAPFHVPGHKRGSGAPEAFMRLVRPPHGSLLQYDLTEIAG
ncbi:hypothetical protein Agub_g5128, partial [Astrephomene gubernaculifera]